MHGSPDRIAEFANTRLGRDRRLAPAGAAVRPRRDEQCDQIAAFGAEVGPHLVRARDSLPKESHMAFLSMRHDFRAPAFAPASSQEIYATALEQFAWADQHGFDSLVLSEHHGVDDGWMPAPLTMAAAVLARTERAPR